LNKPPRLLLLSSAILLGNRTTLLAVLHCARPDIIKPACHCPTCRCSIIEQTRLGCRRLISRNVLQQLIVFAVTMVAVVKADCQSFVAVDIVVIAAPVVAVYSSPLHHFSKNIEIFLWKQKLMNNRSIP
jgi:hypothetical protein